MKKYHRKQDKFDERHLFSTEELDERNKGLQEITEILSKTDIDYFLAHGTLLGAVREKNFIPWDWDVEITILTESIWDKVALFIEEAKSCGFKLIHINQERTNFKINFTKYNNKYCLLGLMSEGPSRVREAHTYPKIFFESKGEIEFRGKIYPAPSDIKGYLTYTYGDWKTPSEDPYNKKKYLSKKVRRDSPFLVTVKNLLVAKWSELREHLVLSLLTSLPRLIRLKRAGREKNFSYMYFSALQKGTKVIEVGSSDGSEIYEILSKENIPDSLSFLIIEPSQYNIDIAKGNLKKYIDNGFNISWTKIAVDNKERSRRFYISKKRPNLNSFTEMPFHDDHISIKTTSLEKVIKEYIVDSPLLIKMDVEGQEVNILNSCLPSLEKLEKVSILFELHPFDYSKDNSLEELLMKLFDKGYEISLVESAGKPIPRYFEKEGYEPFQIHNNRGLYEGVSKDFILKYATRNTQDYDLNGGLSLKQVRSILIEKE